MAYLRRVCSLAAGLVCLCALPAMGQDCLEYQPPPWLDTSADPGAPHVERSYQIEGLLWRGAEFLLVNVGNEISIFTPEGTKRGWSTFNVPPFGDRDYNLFNFSVCNDCSIGVANYETQGSVVFEFRDHITPSFIRHVYYPSAGAVGSFTYSNGGSQFVITAAFSDTSTLYRANDVDQSTWESLQVFRKPGGGRLLIEAGVRVGPAIYLVDSDQTVSIYRPLDTDRIEYVGEAFHGTNLRGHGISYDPDEQLMLTGGAWGVEMYDVSDPFAPSLVKSWNPNPIRFENRTAIDYPLGWVASASAIGSGATWLYDLRTNPPTVVDPQFWNNLPITTYVSNQDGYLKDGKLIYSGYSVILEMSVCELLTPDIFADDFESGDISAW